MFILTTFRTTQLAQSGQNPSNEIPKEFRFRRENQGTQRNHYGFSERGFALFSESMIHVSLPIQILNLFPLLNQTQHLAVILKKQAEDHASTSSGGFLKTLNNLAYERYRIINNKFQTIRYFYSDPNNETLEAEAELVSRDPDFEITQADLEMTDNFLENHKKFTDQTLALGELIKKLRESMADTTTENPRPSNQGHNHARRTRSLESPMGIPNSTNYDMFDPANYTPRIHQVSHLRAKRQIFGFLASLLGSIGISSAFGMVNGQKIDHIAEALSQTVDRQDLMIAQLEADSKHIATNRHLLSNLGDVVSVVSKTVRADHWKLNGVYLFLLIQTELEKLDSLLDTYINAISSACQHKLHIGLLSQEGAREVYRRIHKLAKKSNLVPIINNPTQLSQLPVSYVLTETGFKIIIHCMASSENLTYKLFEFNPFVINMGKSSDNSGPAVFGRITPKNTILAISSDNRFLELSSEELGLCNRIGDIRLCSQNIFNKPSKDTCLSSLFKADHKTSIKLCALALETANSDQVIEISPNKFTYFSQRGSNSYNTICPGSNTIGQLTQFTNLNIPNDCHLDTPDFYIYRRDSLSLEVDPQPQLYEWSLPPLEFFENDLDIKDLETAIQKLESFKGVPEITSGTIQKLQHMKRPLVQNYPLLGTMAIAALAFLFVTILIAAICFQAYRHRQSILKNTDPTYRYKELLKDQNSVNALLELIQAQRAHSNPTAD